MSIDMEDLIIREKYQNFSFHHQILEVKVKETLKKINNGKAMDPKQHTY